MPIEPSLASRFERAARANAQRDAVRSGGRAVTYAALADQASRVADILLDSGIRGGDRVALLFDRGSLAYAGLLGVLKGGALAVPLAPSHPVERLRQIIDDAEPRALLTDRLHAADARALVGRKLPVIEIDDLPAAAERVWPVVEGSDPAVLLYTSGSTGSPKGVLQTHRFIAQKFERVARVLEPVSGDRLALFSTYALGQGFTTIMIGLLAGATLCPFDVRREGMTRLADWLVEERITIYLSSATLFRSLTRTLDGSRRFPDLRLVRIGGERVTPQDVDAHRRLFPAARFFVNYSSTETGSITIHPVDRHETFPGGIVPVGRPFEGMTVRILDDDGRDMALGDEGEIAVQSHYMSDGYWRDVERTARLFMQTEGAGGGRLYRTGDLGRLRPDGCLEHLGRKDLRVKIRGFRIEIEEIETVLNQDPSVRRTAVAARPDADGDLRLVAYVELAPGSDGTVEQLRAQLAIRLPEHMIPSTFVIMDVLPLTDSGKVARQLLPDPPADRPRLAVQCVLPRTGVEAAIAAVWREVLGLETVGVHDAFLSIGGDSLKATLVASRLESKVGVALPLWALFEAPTIAELASIVEQHISAGARP